MHVIQALMQHIVSAQLQLMVPRLQVYRASLWDDVVALKLLEGSSKDGASDGQGAKCELAVLKALRHPNVVQVHSLVNMLPGV